jgi:hypothetical protein
MTEGGSKQSRNSEERTDEISIALGFETGEIKMMLDFDPRKPRSRSEDRSNAASDATTAKPLSQTSTAQDTATSQAGN